MKLSTFDLNHVRALHFLLEEAHVGRAAAKLAITPAAASNALRRLRTELGDPLLAKRGRGLVRTRLGEELRVQAREVMTAADRLLSLARPFDASAYRGPLPIAMAEHVAAVLLPAVDRLVSARAPHATLVIAAIPAAPEEWLDRSGGVLVSPRGAFAATHPADALSVEPFYDDRYVCAMRRGHPFARRRWDAAAYAALGHVLVAPRGATHRSDVDDRLEALGLSRRVARVVSSFTLALPLVAASDWITTLPARSVPKVATADLVVRALPFELPHLAMTLVAHLAHAHDARVRFLMDVLRAALSGSRRP